MSANFLFPDKANFTPDMSETARYLGYRRSTAPDANIGELMEKAAREMQAVMKPQAVFEIFDLTIEGASGEGGMEISFADLTLHSRDLGANLKGCSKVALLAATIGPQVDALIRRNSSLDPVYASILQASGAMFIEEVVDLVNAEIKKIAAAEGLKTRPRYSPGYGDVSLQVQKDFFRLLPCTRIGLTLMDTLIMAPEKSVTAFVGLF
ncbi:MAG: hypothetical protein K5681_10235 [Treponema sp.]|nr:hypothetical protein [Treponema sp.]